MVAAIGLTAALISASGAEQRAGSDGNAVETIQKIRFVEDDAQNYMTSKIYELKYQKANDIVPFVLGAVKRYSRNGAADRINYSAGRKQMVVVSCPEPLVPYIDDMIAKLDRPSVPGPDGSGIAGTGITRNVYYPVWRSGETMVNIMIKAGIPSNAVEGAAQDAVVAFDRYSNIIYWKDSINKDRDLKKYLSWLDRPVPQCELSFKVYEVRESDLLDLGIDYLAWKNGPGLNLFDAGAAFLSGSGMESAFGPYGFFMFAPAFDLSFLRILEQNGRVVVAADASLTVSTGNGASLKFAPTYQNLEKDDKFAASVAPSSNDLMALEVTSPVISLSGKTDSVSGRLGISPGDMDNQSGVVNFSYTLDSRNVVERDNHGNELYDSFSESGTASIRSGGEFLLTDYILKNEVEQTVGVPFLCELPVLKYIFGTTTRNRERTFRFVTVRAELRHPDAEIAAATGRLLTVGELVNNNPEGSVR